ncbi:hypothetical protein RSOLAG1IB_06745 [Rhizoctonia solani AG-1 IB]|uniref:Uncharacterized protein n=1 Tax=Thanatephorus cucumeris (strain AG1-IB / isolate 7/3/14) TaxID=1108050 RepID=A0A0B7FCK7_THACB|nr:hypothetical protein RSOLAG1IB_06745 [Rhizoctonia solani AG-1 IB]
MDKAPKYYVPNQSNPSGSRAQSNSTPAPPHREPIRTNYIANQQTYSRVNPINPNSSTSHSRPVHNQVSLINIRPIPRQEMNAFNAYMREQSASSSNTQRNTSNQPNPLAKPSPQPRTPLVAPPQSSPAPRTDVPSLSQSAPTLAAASQMASVPPADPVPQEPRKQRRTELDLGLSVALEEAINAKNKYILFRLGHIYYPRFKHVISALGMPTYSELNLPGTMMEEYLKILQLSMLRQFVVNQEDWNIAFKLLGAAAFRLFYTEEMEIAASKDAAYTVTWLSFLFILKKYISILGKIGATCEQGKPLMRHRGNWVQLRRTLPQTTQHVAVERGADHVVEFVPEFRSYRSTTAVMPALVDGRTNWFNM